jgi:hypothetical protein
VASVYGHQYVVEDGKSKVLAEEGVDQGPVETEAHAVLMALAVVGAGWKMAATIEVDIEAVLADRGYQLRRKALLVLLVDPPMNAAAKTPPREPKKPPVTDATASTERPDGGERGDRGRSR